MMLFTSTQRTVNMERKYLYHSKKNGIQQSNLRSQCYKFDLDKHPLDVSCQEQAAKGNVQFLVTNAKWPYRYWNIATL